MIAQVIVDVAAKQTDRVFEYHVPASLEVSIGGELGNLTVVSCIIGDLEAGNHMAPGINGHLGVEAYAKALVLLHEPCVRVCEGYLLLAAFLNLAAVAFVLLLAFLCHLKLVLKVLTGKDTAAVLLIHRIELAEILGYMGVQALDSVIKLVESEVAVLGIDCLELAAVNGDEGLGEKLHLKTETVELAEYGLDWIDVELAEIENGPEIRLQLAKKPHYLDVDLALTLKLAGGTDSVVVAVDIKLEKVAWRIAGPALGLRLGTDESHLLKVKSVNEKIHQTGRIIFLYIVVNGIGEKYCLFSAYALNVAHILQAL